MDAHPDRDAVLAEAGRALLDAVVDEMATWVATAVERRRGEASIDAADVARAADAAVAHVEERLRSLVLLDVDAQRQSPLAILREAAGFVTSLLVDAGAAVVERDPDQRAMLADDVFDLGPATFADVGPRTGEAGLVWGAAKALAHRARHQR